MGSSEISFAGLDASVLLILLLVLPPGLSLPTCTDPKALGLQSGALPSSSLSASSSHSPMVGADQGRLHNEAGGGAWCPKGQVGGSSKEAGGANKEWIQVELEPGTVVTGVVVQGRWAGGQGREWADAVVIEVWTEETNSWVEVGGPREANSDTYTAVELSLGAILTPRLRVLPVSVHPRTVCLRLEVLGCQGEAKIMWWGDEYMAAIIGALVTVILCLTAIIVFILWRNSNRAIKDSENLQCNTPGPGSSSSSQSCYTSSYTESNEPVYASSYNESTEYAAPLLLPNHCGPAMDWATFFPPPPTSTPPLPHLLPPQPSPRPLPPSPRPPSSHYAASNIIWAGRRGELGKPV